MLRLKLERPFDESHRLSRRVNSLVKFRKSHQRLGRNCCLARRRFEKGCGQLKMAEFLAALSRLRQDFGLLRRNTHRLLQATLRRRVVVAQTVSPAQIEQDVW